MSRTEIDSNLKLAVAIGTPVEVIDPATNDIYYVLSAEQFRLLSTASTGEAQEIDPQLAYPLVDQIMASDDTDDPLLDSYQ